MPSHCFSRHFSISIDSTFDSIDKSSSISTCLSEADNGWARFDNLRAVVRRLQGYCHRLRHLELEISELDSEYTAMSTEYMDPHLRMAAVDKYREVASRIKTGVRHLKKRYQDETAKEERWQAGMEVGEMLEQVENRTERLVGRLKRKRNQLQWDEDEQEREYLRSRMSTDERRWHRPPDTRTLSSVHQFFFNIDAQTVYLNDLAPPPDATAGTSHTHAQTNKEHFYNLVLARLEEVSRREMNLQPERKGKEVLVHLRRERVYEAFFGERDFDGKALQTACLPRTGNLQTCGLSTTSALPTTSCAETTTDALTGTTIVSTESCTDNDAETGKRKRVKDALKWALKRRTAAGRLDSPGTADTLSNGSDNGMSCKQCLPSNTQEAYDACTKKMPETSKIYYMFGARTGPAGQLAMSAVTNTPVPVRRLSRLKTRHNNGQGREEVVTEGVVVHGLA